MSVNNNPNIAPSDNPFADLSSLKTAELNERETSILSKCNYRDLKTEWTEGLNNISNNARTHMRNVKEVKESFFCYLGNVLGFVNSEPLKEVNKVFSNFDLFDRYVRNDIPQETYKKIAKTNPAYFDKVIEHLEDSAKKLDIKADARIGTFCSSSTGYALAQAATRFRDTADYLKRMMNGDNAAKPGNNNANPGTDRGQPTIINHYHNNIGHIGDINIGHLGDNNFYNKGNMAVMFKGKSNGVPHTGFKSEYSVSKTENLFYSPTINGKKLLELEAEDAVKLLGPGDENKGKKLQMQQSYELTSKAKPLPEEKPANIKQQVNSINIKSEEKENNAVEDNKKDLSEAGVQTEGNGISIQRPISENSFITKERITKGNNQKDAKVQQTDNKDAEKTNKTTDINSVHPKQIAIENLNSRLRDLHAMFFAKWDTIREEIQKQDSEALQDKQKQDEKRGIQNTSIFEKNPMAKGGKITPKNILKEIRDLSDTLHNLAQNNISIHKELRFNAETMLRDIETMMSSDKQTTKQNIENKREKGGDTIWDNNPKDHGIQFPHIGDEDIKKAKAQYTGDSSLKKLLENTWQIIQEIREQVELKKKITNPSPQNITRPKPQSDVKGINVQQKNNPLSSLEKGRQFDIKTGELNKNLKKRVETKGKPQKPSAIAKRKAYSENVVDKKNKGMKTDNTLDPNKPWISNGIQRTADNKNYKTFNSNVTNSLFHNH